MIVISRPPHDNFTFRTFFKLTRKLVSHADIIYMWSVSIDKNINPDFAYDNELFYRKQLFDSINKNLIVLGIKDHLTSVHFNPQTEKFPSMVEYLIDMFNFYKDKQFILFTSMENLGEYITNSNVNIIPWGGDITNQYSQYPKIKPVLDKNLESKTSFLSLNRNKRLNRIMSLSLLFGLGLEQAGLISCMFNKEPLLVDDIGINFKENQVHVKNLINNGFKAINMFDFQITDSRNIYPDNDNDNVFNFENKLRCYYQNTFVDIIAETSFTERSFLVTEKTLNSIYGCSFPLFITSPGFVNFLRKMGFDMFDDIIDHSYDDIIDPIDRAYSAIILNLDLLKDCENTKKLWIKNQHRFLKNVDFAKTKMLEFYQNRTEISFNNVINIVNNSGRYF